MKIGIKPMNITIQDIWESLLESDNGHIQVSPIAILDIPVLKRALTKYKHHEMENIKQLIGDFRLRYEVEKLPDTAYATLNIYRDELPNAATIEFNTRIIIP